MDCSHLEARVACILEADSPAADIQFSRVCVGNPLAENSQGQRHMLGDGPASKAARQPTAGAGRRAGGHQQLGCRLRNRRRAWQEGLAPRQKRAGRRRSWCPHLASCAPTVWWWSWAGPSWLSTAASTGRKGRAGTEVASVGSTAGPARQTYAGLATNSCGHPAVSGTCAPRSNVRPACTVRPRTGCSPSPQCLRMARRLRKAAASRQQPRSCGPLQPTPACPEVSERWAGLQRGCCWGSSC